MLLKCNAKINLGLSVTGKRKDGFHNIESIFLPVPWHDEIEITLSDKTVFTSEGIPIDGKAENNLCLQAYHLLLADFLMPPVHIHLKKNIPIGAGLGGGSSDAAFVLKGLNELFSLNLSIEKLEKYAGQLGSDCTFFIRNQPAFVSGKGEQLEPIDIELKGYCLLVNPNIHISTKEAYTAIRPKKSAISLKEVIRLPYSDWQHKIINDFEAALLPKYSAMEDLKNKLLAMGAYYVAMSGSGSTYFAFFHQKPKKYDFGDDNVMSFDW